MHTVRDIEDFVGIGDIEDIENIQVHDFAKIAYLVEYPV
jgi:hypothetical protein